VTLARRTGRSLCIADREHYNIVDLDLASLFPILPLSQAFEPTMFVVKPSITVISANEFLILSWTGASTLGLFITADGDPVRGTLEWSSHLEAICMSSFSPSSRLLLSLFSLSALIPPYPLANFIFSMIGLDYPYITFLLNGSIEIPSIA